MSIINGVHASQWIKENMPQDGLFQCWWTEDGSASLKPTNLSKRYEFMCKDGKVDGVSTGWWPNGNLKSQYTYKAFEFDSTYHGVVIEYYDINFDNGNDGIEERRYYKNGKLDGKSTAYYINGQKKTESEWEDGLIHGKLKRWYMNGDLMYETEFVNGKGVDIVYYDNKNMKSLTTYDKGKENGLSEDYYPNGILRHKAVMKDNEPIGTNLTYYDDGQLAVEDPFSTNPHNNTSWRNGQKKIYNRRGVLAATLMYAEYHLVDEKLNLPVLSKMKRELLKIIHEPRLIKIVEEYNEKKLTSYEMSDKEWLEHDIEIVKDEIQEIKGDINLNDERILHCKGEVEKLKKKLSDKKIDLQKLQLELQDYE